MTAPMTNAEFIVHLVETLKAFHEQAKRNVRLGEPTPVKTVEEWQDAFISYIRLRWDTE